MASEVTGHPDSPAGVTAIVLAGGRSTRFGSDKAAAPLRGVPLLQWVVSSAAQAATEVVIVAARGQDLPGVTCAVPGRVVYDLWPERGPLAGLVTGLRAASNEVCLALSCDAPLVAPDLLRELALRLGSDGALIPTVGGRMQPLVAAYRKSACLPPFETFVAEGRLALRPAVEALSPAVLHEDAVAALDRGLLSFRNLNTPAELHALAQMPIVNRES